MFKDNKYTRWYYNIVDRARTRDLDGYAETHHIIPKSLGGSNESNNLVNLTAREHYICHLLLVRMTSGSAYQKMLYAYTIMSGRKTYRARRYQLFRKEYAIVNGILRSGEGNGMFGADRKGKNNTFFGRNHTKESKRLISEKKTGVSIVLPPKTEEHKQKIRERRLGTGVIYTFTHTQHGTIVCSIQTLIAKFPEIFDKKYHAAELWKLASGYYKTCKGWQVIQSESLPQQGL